jgi:serine/threonine protein kinase
LLRNIYIGPNDVLKIGCIGLVESISDLLTLAKSSESVDDVLRYISPEILNQSSSYGEKIDIWSFGCIVYELLMLRKAFQGSGFNEIVKNILNNQPDISNIPKTRSNLIISILIEK